MPQSAEYCLDMPPDFPDAELIQYMAYARQVLLSPTKSQAWSEFAGASNLIGWRFRASYEDWQSYERSLTRISNPDHEELYRRERVLFGMFSSGVSCIESTVYSIAALASHPTVLAIPFGAAQQRGCTPKAVLGWLAAHSRAASLSGVLSRLVTSSEWSLWVDLRNRMTHRSNLPRITHVSVGAPPPVTKPILFAATSSTPHVEADTSDFDALHTWLATTLREVLAAGAAL